jgi:hypothetical protein
LLSVVVHKVISWWFSPTTKPDSNGDSSGGNFSSSDNSVEEPGVLSKIESTKKDIVKILHIHKESGASDPDRFPKIPPLPTGHEVVDYVVHLIGHRLGPDQVIPGNKQVINLAKLLLLSGSMVPEEYTHVFIFITFGRKALYDYLDTWEFTRAGRRAEGRDRIANDERRRAEAESFSKPESENGESDLE